jgi:hypothetical protein
MTPAEVVKNIDRLNGVNVTVGGYLAECFGYDCVLYADEHQAKLAREWGKRLRAAARTHSALPGPPAHSWYVNSLGIGSGQSSCRADKPNECYWEFDRQAALLQNSYVLIRGRVTNQCRWKGEPGCTDRSTDLEPTSIRAWKRPGAHEASS